MTGAYDGTHRTASGTYSLSTEHNATQTMPGKIVIGVDYLRGAKYFGVDGKLHPVSVDGVLVHELTHFAHATLEEDLPIMVEGIVVTALGGEQRSNTHQISFERNSNGGFHSFAHKVKIADLSPLQATFSEKAEGQTTSGDGQTALPLRVIGSSAPLPPAKG